jgi:hypothetical protein
MSIKIENFSTAKLPKQSLNHAEEIINTLPREHLRGLDRLRLVDSINDPRLRTPTKSPLPGLYHPRQGSISAWIEVSTDALLPRSPSFFKKIMPRLSFKGNLAAIIFSLVGQHYYLTLRHSVKKTQLETSVRAYTEKHLKIWSGRQHSFRSRLFKPLQPKLERWARALHKRAATAKRKDAQ